MGTVAEAVDSPCVISVEAATHTRPSVLVFAAILAAFLTAMAMPNAATAKHVKSAGAKHATKARGCKHANSEPSAWNRGQIRRATLCLVNRERTRRGRRALKRNRTLERVASRYTRRMVDEDFFDHVSPGGSTLTQRVRRTQYLQGSLKRWSLGENIAWATGRLATPSQVVADWMKSPGHRRNILDGRFREAGFGVVAGVPDPSIRGSAATYTNVFGQRVHR